MIMFAILYFPVGELCRNWTANAFIGDWPITSELSFSLLWCFLLFQFRNRITLPYLLVNDIGNCSI